MFTVILILVLVVCVILAFAVLIQNPKGGGLSGTFGGTANQLFGYKRTSDDIERITWGLGIALMVLSLSSAAFKPSSGAEQNTPFGGQATQPVNQSLPTPDNTQNLPSINGDEPASQDGGGSESNEELPD